MINNILARVTPKSLTLPAPSQAELEQAIAAAQAAPDHGRLKPWRFHLIEGPARERLGEVMAQALKVREPEATPELLKKEAAKPLRAPIIVAISCLVQPSAKIPASEQLMAVAAAAQNFQLAIHALGYGCQWKSGAPVRDPLVKAAFGLGQADTLVGFMYVGSIAEAGPARSAVCDTDRLSNW
jgi:nitroreductase